MPLSEKTRELEHQIRANVEQTVDTLRAELRERLESGYLYLGSPVKQIRPLGDKEKFFIEYSWKHYMETKNSFLKTLRQG